MKHFALFDDHDGRRCQRRRRPHANPLPCQAPFAKKSAWAQNSQNCFFARFIDDGKFYAAFQNAHHRRSGVTLRIEMLRFPIPHLSFRHARRMEKSLRVQKIFTVGGAFAEAPIAFIKLVPGVSILELAMFFPSIAATSLFRISLDWTPCILASAYRDCEVEDGGVGTPPAAG